MPFRITRHGLHTLMLCAVALSVVATGFAQQVTPGRVASQIEQIMRAKWTCQNLQVRVQPFANDALTQQGRFQAIVVEASSISRKGITVSPFYMKAFDVTLDLNRMFRQGDITTARRRNTIMNARVEQGAINRLLAMKEMPVRNPRVQLGNGTLTMTGQYQAVMGHNLQMVARLQVLEQSKVNLAPTSVRVNGVPLPAGPMRSLLSSINPLLDLTEIPLSPRLDSISITPQAVVLKG